MQRNARLGITLVAAVLIGAVQAAPVKALRENCVDIQPNNQHAGITNSDATLSRYGARADIVATFDNPNGATFLDCLDTNGLDAIAGSSAWVALIPRVFNPNSIVQIGVIRCTSPNFINVNEVCWNHPGEFRYFWAAGGCGVAIPYPRDLGPAAAGTHNFKVQTSSASFGLYIDNASSPTVLISRSDQGVSCWSFTNMAAQIASERWDRGDTWGSSGDESRFTTTQVKTAIGGPWITLNYPDGCHFNAGGAAGSYNRTFCTKPSGSSMRTWD